MAELPLIPRLCDSILKRLGKFRVIDVARGENPSGAALGQQLSLQTKGRLRFLALNSKERGVASPSSGQQLIVSLTTYGERIHEVYLTIESLFQQFRKADKVVLWLAEDEFSRESLPNSLLRAEERGLEIGFCRDIKSYKKLIPTLEKYPKDLIITADDDIFYPPEHIDGLFRAYVKAPKVVPCVRGWEIVTTDQGKFESYAKWPSLPDSKVGQPMLNLFPTGGAGALYFPGCFHPDVVRDDLFMDLCPTADDIWFKAMTLANGIPSQLLIPHQGNRFMRENSNISASVFFSLYIINGAENGRRNNEQMDAVFTKYNLSKKLIEETE